MRCTMCKSGRQARVRPATCRLRAVSPENNRSIRSHSMRFSPKSDRHIALLLIMRISPPHSLVDARYYWRFAANCRVLHRIWGKSGPCSPPLACGAFSAHFSRGLGSGAGEKLGELAGVALGHQGLSGANLIALLHHRGYKPPLGGGLLGGERDVGPTPLRGVTSY